MCAFGQDRNASLIPSFEWGYYLFKVYIFIFHMYCCEETNVCCAAIPLMLCMLLYYSVEEIFFYCALLDTLNNSHDRNSVNTANNDGDNDASRKPCR